MLFHILVEFVKCVLVPFSPIWVIAVGSKEMVVACPPAEEASSLVLALWIGIAPIVWWTPTGFTVIEILDFVTAVAAIVEECTATASREASIDRITTDSWTFESIRNISGPPNFIVDWEQEARSIGIIALMNESLIER